MKICDLKSTTFFSVDDIIFHFVTRFFSFCAHKYTVLLTWPLRVPYIFALKQKIPDSPFAMYTFPRASDVYGTNSSSMSLDDPSHFPPVSLPPPHLLDHVTGSTHELDSVMGHSHSSSNSSGYSSYSSPSYGTTSQMQRSISSHSLQKNNNCVHSLLMLLNDHSVETDISPVRRVFSTGDLHVSFINTENNLNYMLTFIIYSNLFSRFSFRGFIRGNKVIGQWVHW